MSKTNDFQKDTAAPAVAATAATPASVPAVATAATAWADEHQGAGGAYEMVNGQRVLVSRTQAADQHAQG